MSTMYPVIASYLGTEVEAPSSSWSDSLAQLFKDINSKYAALLSPLSHPIPTLSYSPILSSTPNTQAKGNSIARRRAIAGFCTATIFYPYHIYTAL